MNLKQLRYFLTIVEEGQITAAAKKLHIAQPPLSYQLRILEEELGVKLLKRGAREVTLTPAGRLFKQRAEQILSLTDATARELHLFGVGEAGTISIGTISSSSSVIPDQSIVDFAKEYPSIQFDIHEGNTYEVIEMLEKRIIDVGVIRTPFKEEGLSIRYANVEPIVAVFPKGKCGEEKEEISLSELGSKPLIIYRRFSKLVNQVFENQKITPNIRCMNDDARTTLNWARAGFGVGIVPLSALSLNDQQELSTRKIEAEELTSQMAIVWKEENVVSPLVETFIELFSESIISK